MDASGVTSAALHRCPALTGRSRLWSGASLPFGRLSWRPPRACRAARPRTTPMRTRNPPRGALLAFGASGMVQFSGLWSGLRYSAESRLRYSAESQYSPTPPITADITVQPFQAATLTTSYNPNSRSAFPCAMRSLSAALTGNCSKKARPSTMD